MIYKDYNENPMKGFTIMSDAQNRLKEMAALLTQIETEDGSDKTELLNQFYGHAEVIVKTVGFNESYTESNSTGHAAAKSIPPIEL